MQNCHQCDLQYYKDAYEDGNNDRSVLFPVTDNEDIHSKEAILRIACRNGNRAVIKRVLEDGANALTYESENPLITFLDQQPMFEPHYDLEIHGICRSMFLRGSDINATEPTFGQNGLAFASAALNIELMKLFLNNGTAMHPTFMGDNLSPIKAAAVYFNEIMEHHTQKVMHATALLWTSGCRLTVNDVHWFEDKISLLKKRPVVGNISSLRHNVALHEHKVVQLLTDLYTQPRGLKNMCVIAIRHQIIRNFGSINGYLHRLLSYPTYLKDMISLKLYTI